MGGCKHTHPNVMHVVINVILLKGYEPAAHSCWYVSDTSNASALIKCDLTHRGMSEYVDRLHLYDLDHTSCPAAVAAFAALMLIDALVSRGSGKDLVLKLPYCGLLARRVYRVGPPPNSVASAKELGVSPRVGVGCESMLLMACGSSLLDQRFDCRCSVC